MTKIENFNIVTTFLGLWLAVYLSAESEVYLASFFILTVGLLHGSNDIKIIGKVLKKKSVNYYKILFLYVLAVIFGAIMFYFIPVIALISFVLVSGFHFGEQHFHYIKSENRLIKYLFFLSYGCVLIFLLLWTNAAESISIISQITDVEISESYFKYAFIISGIVLIACAFILRNKISNPFRELFNLIVFFIVFKTASLLWAFAIYFVLWHSVPSIIDQTKFLFKDVNKASLKKYVKTSLLYWIISVVGLIALLAVLIKESDLFYAVFFSFLAAITFPHVFVMSKIFKH